jgi:hypothetical protein
MGDGGGSVRNCPDPRCRPARRRSERSRCGGIEYSSRRGCVIDGGTLLAALSILEVGQGVSLDLGAAPALARLVKPTGWQQ